MNSSKAQGVRQALKKQDNKVCHSCAICRYYIDLYRWHILNLRRGSRNFSKGVLRRKILKEKCLLIHVSTRVHIKSRQTCNSFSLLPFQEGCLLFFVLFYYSLLFFKLERGGGCNPRNLALDPPMNLRILGLLIRTNAMVLHPYLFLCCLVVQSRSESGIYLFLQLDGYIILSKSLIIKANFKQLNFFNEIAVWPTQWYLLLI